MHAGIQASKTPKPPKSKTQKAASEAADATNNDVIRSTRKPGHRAHASGSSDSMVGNDEKDSLVAVRVTGGRPGVATVVAMPSTKARGRPRSVKGSPSSSMGEEDVDGQQGKAKVRGPAKESAAQRRQRDEVG